MREPTFASELVILINAHHAKGVPNVDILRDLDTWREHVARWTTRDANTAAKYLAERARTEGG